MRGGGSNSAAFHIRTGKKFRKFSE